MSGKASAATVGVAATGTTATVGVGTEAAREAIPILELPLFYIEIGGHLTVIPVQNAVFLLTAFLSSIAVLLTIGGVIRRWFRKEAKV